MRRATLKGTAKQVGRGIAVFRRERGLTQEELAEEAGFTARYLQAVEAGGENLTLESLVEFANLLQVAVTDLFHGPTAPAAIPRRTKRRM
jgi:transcriptional regulator with XRE-family HTH domain